MTDHIHIGEAKEGSGEPEVTSQMIEFAPNIPSDHEQYLLSRHGTLFLKPLPSADPADPLNWPGWKKHANLFLVAFHGLMSTGSAVAVVPAFVIWSKLYGISITKASYLGSSQMITLAWGPVLWIPIANHYGRRPVWLISVIGAGLFNVGCAVSKTYSQHMICRILSAFFISPAVAMGQATVTEMFFAHERARKMGIWALMITIGTPLGPFVMGFVVDHLDWTWVYWIMAILNLAQCVGYLFFGPETVYDRLVDDGFRQTNSKEQFRNQYLRIRKITRNPLTASEFVRPFFLLADPRIGLSAMAYTITFAFTFVLFPLETPQLFFPFHLTAQQTGLNFLGLLVGSVLGEQVGGPFSDYIQNRRRKTNAEGRTPPPEYRLRIAQIGFPLAIAGIAIYMVTLADSNRWNIKPAIGMAVGGFGCQVVTTVIITYCSDCYREISSSAIGVGINVVRCTWGFIVPFWIPHMTESIGLKGSTGLMAGIIIVFSILPILLLQWQGHRMGNDA